MADLLRTLSERERLARQEALVDEAAAELATARTEEELLRLGALTITDRHSRGRSQSAEELAAALALSMTCADSVPQQVLPDEHHMSEPSPPAEAGMFELASGWSALVVLQNPSDAVAKAASLLSRLFRNLTEHPQEPRFRKIRLSNPRIAAVVEGAMRSSASLKTGADFADWCVSGSIIWVSSVES
eukprot:SAG31_NODE_328_length_17643_cov_46.707649_1_plen_187_part_00